MRMVIKRSQDEWPLGKPLKLSLWCLVLSPSWKSFLDTQVENPESDASGDVFLNQMFKPCEPNILWSLDTRGSRVIAGDHLSSWKRMYVSLSSLGPVADESLGWKRQSSNHLRNNVWLWDLDNCSRAWLIARKSDTWPDKIRSGHSDWCR